MVLARFFGTDLFGLLTHSQSWSLLFLNFTGLGIVQILGRVVGGDAKNAQDTINETLGLRISAIIITVPICLIWGYIANDSELSRWLIFWFSLSIIGRALSAWSDNFFTAHEENYKVLILTIVFRSMEIVAGLISIYLGGGIILIAVIHAASWVAQGIFGIILAFKRQKKLAPSFNTSKLLKLLKIALPLSFANGVCAWLINGPVVLYRHSGAHPNELGQFGLLMSLFGILSTLFLSMSISALPVISRAMTKNDASIHRFLSSAFRSTILIGTIIGLAALLLGEPIVTMIIGDSYFKTAQWAGPIAIGIIPYGLASVSLQVLSIRQQYKPLVFASSVTAITLAIALPALSAWFNFTGAVIGVAAAITIWAISLGWLTLIEAPKTLKTDAIKGLSTCVITFMAFAIVTRFKGISHAFPTAIIVFLILVKYTKIISQKEWTTIITTITNRLKKDN